MPTSTIEVRHLERGGTGWNAGQRHTNTTRPIARAVGVASLVRRTYAGAPNARAVGTA